MSEYCTCQPGRDTDGSEFGACSYCERMTDEEERCATCGGSGREPESEAWPRGRPCPDCALTEEERRAWQDVRDGMNR